MSLERSKNPWLLADFKVHGLWGSKLQVWMANPTRRKENTSCSFCVRSPDDRWSRGVHLHERGDVVLLLKALDETMKSPAWKTMRGLTIHREESTDYQTWKFATTAFEMRMLDALDEIPEWLKLKELRPDADVFVVKIHDESTVVNDPSGDSHEPRVVDSVAFFDSVQWAFAKKALEGLAALRGACEPRQ